MTVRAVRRASAQSVLGLSLVVCAPGGAVLQVRGGDAVAAGWRGLVWDATCVTAITGFSAAGLGVPGIRDLAETRPAARSLR